jgi:hypothetical protein
MTALIRNITIDCANAYKLAAFWSQVTGYQEDPEDPNEPEHTEALLVAPEGQPRLLFMQVPESKSVKNRAHLDLMPTDRSRDEEVDRLLGLGATLFADHRRPDGTGWAVLADPEGNEFCVERSVSERLRVRRPPADQCPLHQALRTQLPATCLVEPRTSLSSAGWRGWCDTWVPDVPRARRRRDKGLTLPPGQGRSSCGMNAPAKEVARTAVSANGLRKASASRCGDRRGHLGVVCDETRKGGEWHVTGRAI